MSAALRVHLEGLPSFERQNLELDRWGEIARVADQFGVDRDAVRVVLKEIRPKPNADRFEWLQATCQRHDLGVRALRTSVAVFSFAGEGGYLWPSQKALAQRAGYADDAEIRRGLASLVAIGALRKLRITNLPRHLTEKALSAVKEGGSGRSVRGTAYALVPAKEWLAPAHTGTSCPSKDRDTVSLLNLQVKPPLSSTGDSSNIGDSISTSPLVETSNWGTEGGRHA